MYLKIRLFILDKCNEVFAHYTITIVLKKMFKLQSLLINFFKIRPRI